MRILTSLALLLASCGAPPEPIDAGQPTPLTCTGNDLIIAAVEPMETVWIFNPTDVEVDVASTAWVLCQRPNYVQLEMIEPGVRIPPHGTHAFAMPGAFFDQGPANGELALYRTSSFTDPFAMVDYVCWGTGREENRRDVAEDGGHFSGDCARSIDGVLVRLPDTDGRSAGSYDTAGAGPRLSCDP